MMTQKRDYIKQSILYLFLVLLFAACIPQEPIRIIVSATPQATSTVQATATTEVLLTDTLAPSETHTPMAAPLHTASPTAAGDGRFFGAIVGADYTPPPTSTPRLTSTQRPSQTPTSAIPSVTPIPETPVSTPLTNLPSLNSELMGIQLYYNLDINSWWEIIQRTKPTRVQWVKMQADWSWLQPNNADQFDETFRLFQSHVQRAHNDGFKVLISIAKAPAWARGGNAAEDGAPVDPEALAYFIRFMLDKVGSQTSAIEIWNEPNLRREWNGGLEWSGAGYMQLFRPAYAAVRAYSADMPIITAGLAPTSSNVELGSLDDRDFLRQMYAAGLNSPDFTNVSIGIHPYGWGNPPDMRCCNQISDRGWDEDPHFFFIQNIEDMRQIMLDNGDSTRKLWATEFGWSSWSGIPTAAPELWMTYTSPEQQAAYTMRAFEIAQSFDYMGVMFLWNLNFANDRLIQERNEMVGYSLFIPTLPIRPLYAQLSQRP